MRGYNPANESYDEWDRDRKSRRMKYWSAIRKLNAEFDTTDSNLLFNQWVLQTFGIRIIYSNEGHTNITGLTGVIFIMFIVKMLIIYHYTMIVV
jgi:hypothetical protein